MTQKKEKIKNRLESEEEEVKMEISKLPNEMLGHIFTFLTYNECIAIEEVSSLWGKLSRETSKKKNIIKFSDLLRVSEQPILNKILVRCSPHAQVMDFCDLGE